MTNWKETVLEQLTNKPENWCSLGELFNQVADDIPMHTALRRVASNKRHDLRRKGLEDTVVSTDFDLAKAQWLLFTQFILPLVERKDNIHRATQIEQVRLKPHDNCKTCGSPTYIAKLSIRGARKAYKCFNCAKPKLELVSTTPVIKQPPAKRKRNTRRYTTPLRLVPASPPAIQQLPKPIRPPKPKPETVVIPVSLHSLTSLNQVWNVYKEAIKQPLPASQSNPKLRKMLYRAMEAGAFDQYNRMLHFKTSELRLLQVQCTQIWFSRAFVWMNQTFTTANRRRWHGALAEAFGFGSVYILALTRNNLLEVIYNEMEEIRTKLEPPPKQAKPIKNIRQRWGTPIKSARSMVSRWFMK
jgi:hypothetical protein